MAIYHLSVKSVSRGEGRSATAASAYRAGEKVHDLETGQVFDYTRKRGVEHAEIVLSSEAAKQDINWARNRQDLWNAAERAERRKDARIAREYEVALPNEMSATQRLALTRAFAQELANRYRCAVDFAIHKPHREGDERNHHAHLLATTREITPTGLGAKTAVEWSNTDRRRHGLQSASDEMTEIRGRWATLANEHLRARTIDAQIDHRSLKAQGIEREPTVHKGPELTAIERREKRCLVAEHQREEAGQRLAQAMELGRLERESAQLKSSILDLSNDIQAARRERDRTNRPSHDLEAERRQARDAWRVYRAREGVESGPTEKSRPRDRGLELPDV
jgi:ATP-dependent exoDNAse (exonuclease V) alpha subunit